MENVGANVLLGSTIVYILWFVLLPYKYDLCHSKIQLLKLRVCTKPKKPKNQTEPAQTDLFLIVRFGWENKEPRRSVRFSILAH